jgi:hypothetical protein
MILILNKEIKPKDNAPVKYFFSSEIIDNSNCKKII